ncbi:MAG: TolC family protein [Phycisphaerales bacterium JB059]
MRAGAGWVGIVVVVAASGCARTAIDVFEPDWGEDLDEERRRFRPQPTPAISVEGEEVGAGTNSPTTAAVAEEAGPLELSLERMVMLSLARNPDLRVAELNPAITGAFELVERGVFDPEVFAEASLGTEESVESARATGEQFPVRGDTRDVIAGVRQSLPSGTDVELSISQDRSASNRAPTQESARVGLTVTQSLLRGFGPAANLARVRQAELETEASQYELRGFVEALLADAERAYWRYVLAGRRLAIFERSLEFARTQADEASQRVDVGVLPPSELPAFEVEVAVREQALIDARAEEAAARLELLRLVGALGRGSPALDGRTVVATTTPEVGSAVIDDVSERVELARLIRPDLAEGRLRLEQDRLEVVATRRGLLPRLDVFVALGKTGFAESFGGSVENLGDETFDASVGVRFSQSLGRLVARGERRAALASRQQAAAAIENLEQLVAYEVRLAVHEVERARRQIDASATTRRLQSRTAEAERERFRAGAGTSLLVAQAQRDLLEAEIAEVAAVVEYRLALIDLYVAEGSLLERRGITIAMSY